MTSISARVQAVLRGGVRQTGIELRIQFTSALLLGWLVMPASGLAAMFLVRDTELMDTGVSIAQVIAPGLIAMMLFVNGVLVVSGQLVTERDNGTLLRAKTVPGGIQAHLISTMLINLLMTAFVTAMILLGTAIFSPGIGPYGWGWLGFFGVIACGALATLPLGVVLGAVIPSALAMSLVSLVAYGTLAISGIFFPISQLPGIFQIIGQGLPTYWLGAGLRTVMLPPQAATAEIGGSWNIGLTLMVLAVWTAIGLVLTPWALRRVARGQSGSHVAAVRERVMRRGY